MNTDPNLIAPGSDPSTAGLRSNPLGQPVSVKPHPFQGTTVLKELMFYWNTIPGASMHRPDGTKIAFLFNICATNLKQNIEYLEKEIEDGHGYVRHATAEEIQIYKMRTDPRGTLTEELRPQLELELRAKIEAEIRERLMGQAIDVDSALLSGVDKVGEAAKVVRSGTGTVTVSSDQAKVPAQPKPLTPAQQLAAMAAATQRPPITPVSTADIASAAAGSAGAV